MIAEPGRIEARIKLPPGQGLWPAFWMLGHNAGVVPWPACGELDVMENKGSQSNATSSAVHGPGYSGATPFAHLQNFSAGTSTSDFHTYAVEWDSLHVKFFVDGTPHYEVTRNDIEKYGSSIIGQPFWVILNLAVGGHFDGDPQSDAIFPATMLVDYVRVFAPKAR
jgi:beta-glucanase (GH16 family)